MNKIDLIDKIAGDFLGDSFDRPYRKLAIGRSAQIFTKIIDFSEQLC
ncbi:hypothetical protein [Microcoleus sp. bin38.metabat.b11b12b14.051]|nr:hypothetical protein [Microcoleus sp. bin38.metabat.b11b12b14.051]